MNGDGKNKMDQPQKTTKILKWKNTMDRTKKIKKIIIAGLIVLGLICIIQGGIIYQYVNEKSPDDSIFNAPDRFSAFLDDKFKTEKERHWDLFDRFFDDRFFSNHLDPFKEMERMQKHLEGMMGGHSRKMFENSWKGWFDDRYFGGSSDIDIQKSELKDSYEISIHIPNLNENNLNIDIDKDAILIEGEFSQTIEKKDANGNFIGKHEIHQQLSKRFPVPSDADVDKAKVNKEKDRIIIHLPKVKA